jgi:tetratricopeptide (TPR) repeat protein
MGLFFYYLATEKYEQALHEAQMAYSPSVAHPHIASALALLRLGRAEEAATYLEKTNSMAPGLLDRLRAELTARQTHPELIDMVIDTLGPVRSRVAVLGRQSASRRG